MSEARSPILLVEDTPADVALFQHAARGAKFFDRLQIVNDGEAAVAYLAGQEPYADRARYPLPAVIVLDLKLPRKSGFEVLSWLRAQPGLRRIPVVVLTGSGVPSDLRRAYDLGANSYLVKPIGFQTLVEMVVGLHHYWTHLNEVPDFASSPGEA
ncbi:MAG: response regulator [Planctomycetes bacterium]|nr:response regulator [Planctomycetota bacterium]